MVDEMHSYTRGDGEPSLRLVRCPHMMANDHTASRTLKVSTEEDKGAKTKLRLGAAAWSLLKP